MLHHGPSLVSLAKEEQGDDEGSVVDFLSPKSTGNQGWNYFRNFLEVSTNGSKKSAQRTFGGLTLLVQTVIRIKFLIAISRVYQLGRS